MKYIIGLLVMLLLFTACQVEQTVEADVDAEELEEMVDDLLETPKNVVMDDAIIHSDTNITVEVKDDIIETTINETIVEDHLTATFEEWCIPGKVYAQTDENVDYQATLTGVTTFKGSQFCQGEATQVMDTPAG